MDAQTFLAEFAHIADAPGGVERLREMILALAVQGRLIAQNENEEPAFVQLEIIRKHAGRYEGANRKNKKTIDSAELFLTDNNVRLPEGWARVPLSDLVRVINGRAYSRSEFRHSGVPVLRVGNLFTSNAWHYSDLELEKDKYCDNGDLLYAWSASFGPFIWSGGKVIFHYHIWKLDFFSESNVDKRYLYFYLLEKTNEIKSSGHGISMAHMTKERFERLGVLLPPLKEQSRIVAKVDELMSLCDKLEAQQQARRRLQNNLRQSALHAVVSAANPQELQAAWARLDENFGQIFDTPGDVSEFVAEANNLAVLGFLSLPSSLISPLDKVVADCDALREQYISSGLMRRQKPVSTAESNVSYPKRWSAVPFDKVALISGGVTKGRDLRGRDVVTCPYLAVANVQRGVLKLTELKTIQIKNGELQKYLVKEGDLLITEGGDWDKVGRTAIWRGGIDNCIHQNHVFKARVPSSSLLNEWVELVLNSGAGRSYFAEASKQTTNLASINMTQLRNFPMPVPPLDEQRQILAKLDVLAEQAGLWREQLERSRHLAALLAHAAVATFTGIAIEQREGPMKTPQTELIAPLRLGKSPGVKAQAPLATILARHKGEMSARDLWQRFTGEIDAFYAQLKTEVANGWILEPDVAEMREKATEDTGA